MSTKFIDIVFTALPGGPLDPKCEFVEVEDDKGAGLKLGAWKLRGRYGVLRFQLDDLRKLLENTDPDDRAREDAAGGDV